MTGVVGDSQVAATGSQLPFPLSFVVRGSTGKPSQGATVSWTVTPADAATPSPAVSTTDGQGTASTTITLGNQIGPVVVRAAVSGGGIDPFDFHLTAVDPCTYYVPYALGATVSGSLTKTDCNGNLFFVDFLKMDLPAEQQSLHISMSSSAFDTWVELYRLGGEYLAFNGDVASGATAHSRIDVIAAPGGSFVIAPSSWDTMMTGPYTLSAELRPATLANCNLVWVTRGVTVADAIMPTDCVDSTGGAAHYFDNVAIYARIGSVLRIAARSAAINPTLRLFNRGGTQVAANDDSASGNPNAYIEYAVPSAGPFLILVGTSTAQETGPYVLTVAAATTPSGAAARSEPIRPGLMRLPKGWPPLPGGRRGH
ncbi:MAG TPA: Ig-like domain-containing protein [Gemmatimonadales bacterium]|nr:Ig-like domain-containing protein [Gemmatimonadales bacterium]